MIKDPCLYSDSNLLPVLQVLPLISRHKETEWLEWLPRRQQRQPSLGVQVQPRSALNRLRHWSWDQCCQKALRIVSKENKCEKLAGVRFLSSQLKCDSSYRLLNAIVAGKF